MIRISMPLGLLLTAAAMLPMPALAASGAEQALAAAAPALAPNDWSWNDGDATGKLSVVVSIPDQRAYVYRGAQMVAVSSVSTGRDGKETPVGSFTILQKAVTHKSNKYNSAPMPYMERLTWDGVAIHAGDNPGFPTSHGCIHVPIDFARKLYSQTRVGTQVEVTDASIIASDPALLPADVIAQSQEETAKANAAQLAATSPAE